MKQYEELFEKIKKLVENGTDINYLTEGKSFLFDYLESYYWWHIELKDEPYYEGMLDDLMDRGEEPFPEEKTRPLDKRDSLILEHLNWFFKNGIDPNKGTPSMNRPLTEAVGNSDAFVTEYLLQHGADPNYDDSDKNVPWGCGNRRIDELDAQALNSSFDDPIDTVYFDAMYKTCRILLKYGAKTANGRLHCFDIDMEKRTVSLRPAELLY